MFVIWSVQFGSICRKVAKNILTEKKHRYLITSRNLEKYLGKKIFREDLDDLSPQIGVTTGMAWDSCWRGNP